MKTTKPTGGGVCPPHVDRAHFIEGLINERAATRDLSDADFDDMDGEDDEGLDQGDAALSGEDITPIPIQPKVAVVRGVKDQPPMRRNGRGNGLELVEKMSQAFDPAAQDLRDQQRTHRAFQSTQMFAMAQRERDSQTLVESLRTQMNTLQGRVYEAERARELLQFKLELQMRDRTHAVAVPRPRKKFRNEVHYGDGGGSVTWVSDNAPSEDSEVEIVEVQAKRPTSARSLKRTYAFHETLAPYSPTQQSPVIIKTEAAIIKSEPGTVETKPVCTKIKQEAACPLPSLPLSAHTLNVHTSANGTQPMIGDRIMKPSATCARTVQVENIPPSLI